MEAFHNDNAIKNKYLARVKAHAKADEIVKGQYWQNGKGCAVGCTIHGHAHKDYETELGIPRIIARLEDRIFECLPNEEAKKFPLQFLEAIPVGADLSGIWPQFAIWLLVDETWGVVNYAKTERSKQAIAKIAELYQRQLAGQEIALTVWRGAKSAAAAAADADADASDYIYSASSAASDAAVAAAAVAASAYSTVDAAAYAASDAAAAAAYFAVDDAAYSTVDDAYADAAASAYSTVDAYADAAAAAAADAAYAASSAAYSAAYSADDDAAVDAADAARSLARSQVRMVQRDKLLELLRSA